MVRSSGEVEEGAATYGTLSLVWRRAAFFPGPTCSQMLFTDTDDSAVSKADLRTWRRSHLRWAVCVAHAGRTLTSRHTLRCTLHALAYPSDAATATVWSMHDHQTQTVWQFVHAQRRRQPRQELEDGTLHEVHHLVHQLRTTAGFTDLDDDALGVSVALSWFGPADAGAPPLALHEELITLLRQDIHQEETRRARSTDVVIAYGCGNWRQIPQGGGSWEHRWPRALSWVTQHLFGWLKATAAWLHFDVRLPGYALVTPLPSRETAMALAHLLWLGTCDCWRVRFSDATQAVDPRTALRRARCHREHDLAAWNPAEMALTDFLARAVKGDKVKGDRSGRKGFASGAVFQGMFFGELYREHDIRLGRVLLWRCPHHPALMFEGDQCFVCEEAGAQWRFEETRHRRDVVRRLLVKAPTGPYEAEQYWHCQGGDTYYQLQHACCPLCQRPRTPGAAKSTVWIRQPLRHVDAARALPSYAAEQPDADTRLLLTEALNQLPPLQRDLLVLVQIQGMPKRLAAQQLDLPLPEVNAVLDAALATLRALLTQDVL